jgi:hypothetical protein
MLAVSFSWVPVPLSTRDFGMTSKTPNQDLPEPIDALYRIKRGLSGYVSYLAACEMNESFSKYVLYEPILRILTARGYSVECEVECPGIMHEKIGDRKRLDFVAKGNGQAFALEVKWANRKSVDIKQDLLKLAAYRKASKGVRAFLCVFGKQSIVANLALRSENLKQKGRSLRPT